MTYYLNYLCSYSGLFCFFFNLREYMRSETVMDPPSAKTVLTEWQNGQEKLNSRRLELVNSLRWALFSVFTQLSLPQFTGMVDIYLFWGKFLTHCLFDICMFRFLFILVHLFICKFNYLQHNVIPVGKWNLQLRPKLQFIDGINRLQKLLKTSVFSIGMENICWNHFSVN